METRTATQIIGGNPNQRRSESDFYPTPSEVTETLLNFLDLPKTTVIWEPACGEMDMVSAMQRAGYSVFATDLKYGQDFLTMPLTECDWVITNPPFSESDKFIKRCAEHGKPFALLLKSQYWHARKRYDLFKNITPTYVCPLTWRPDFLFKKHEKRCAPLMDVMWCVWLPPYSGKTIYQPLRRAEDGK
jgi:type I restriction-modification system DNA methylase subunit